MSFSFGGTAASGDTPALAVSNGSGPPSGFSFGVDAPEATSPRPVDNIPVPSGFSFGVAPSGGASPLPASNSGQPTGFTFGVVPLGAASPSLASRTRQTTGFSFDVAPKKHTTPVASLDSGVDGVAQFQSRPGAEYRFQLTAKNDKLGIWIEDRQTKKQWQTSNLTMEDFVKEDSTIPQASFQDYVSCFLNCLQAPTTSDAFARDLLPSPCDSDGWELRLTLKTRVFLTVWTPTYSFLLKSVPLDPVDLLASRIRDQEDQIRQLQTKLATTIRDKDDRVALLQSQVKTLNGLVKAMPRGGGPAYWRAVITQQFGQNQTLVWKSEGLGDGNKGEIQLQANGIIQLTTAAVYVVHVSLRNTNANNSTTVELHVNAKPVAICVDSTANAHNHVSTIHHVFQAKLMDELSVVYRGNNQANPTGSYLTIYELR